MLDRCEKNHEPHEIPRTISIGANINTGSRELVRLVSVNAGVGAGDATTIVVIENDQSRWPNAYFTALGLFCLEQAHAAACQSSRR
jgi:hypothetical protein